MNQLSSPIESIKSHYPIVIIGSGYGGSIAASRLSRAGQKICLLERGLEIRPGEYPDDLITATEHTQLHTPEGRVGSPTAMLDFHTHPSLTVLVGCGLGGTSLINANVSIKPDERVFKDTAWPVELRQEYDDPQSRLSQGYQRAEEMLKPNVLPDHIKLDKIDGLKRSADMYQQKVYRTRINVNFTVDGPNHVGVHQKPCNMCGDCCSGCNNHAKNTLLMNYLPDAKNHGAEIFTGAEVSHIERKYDKWIIHFHIAKSGEKHFDSAGAFITADTVIVSAGTLGSTEIMLRSKAKGLKISDQTGKRMSGNGDVIGFAYDTEYQINGMGYGRKKVPQPPHTAGPCITSVIDIRDTADVNDGMIIEDAVGPGAISKIMPKLLAASQAFIGRNEVSADSFTKKIKRFWNKWKSVLFGSYTGAMKNTQTYLVMSHDKDAGQMKLIDNRLQVDYPKIGREEIFQKIDHTLANAARALNGIYIKNPMWTKLMQDDLITVHPLGGCYMGENFQEAVVNHKGQVFSGETASSVYENFYITDGAVVPRSLGVNPLFTISAISERCVAILAEDRGWKIDYNLPAVKSESDSSTTVGMEFTEKMTGYFSIGVQNNDYQSGYDNGKETHTSFEFILTIRSEDVHDMLTNPDHQALMAGSVTAPALSAQPMSALEGVFNLFVDDPANVNTKLMKYRMNLYSEEGKEYFFTGYKIIQKHSILKMWHDTSTLYITIYEGKDDQGKIIGQGMLHIQPEDFIKQLSTMKAVNATSVKEAFQAEKAFGAYFSKSLFYEYAGLFSPDEYYHKDEHRKRRTLRLCPPEFFPFKTDDGVELLLTRYNGGAKGPLMMVHGFSGSRLTFTIDTIETNLAEYFYEKGYDVWLFDYRLSNLLPSSKNPQTLDAIANYDYKAAIALIKDKTKVSEIDALVHCVGSITMFMAIMNGLEGIRSLISAQIASDVIGASQPKLKCGLHAPELLEALGLTSLNAYADDHENWKDKLFDKFLKLYAEPLAGYCNSPTCHRLTFMFGPLYQHHNLNEATHDAQVEMFQIANLKTYEQLAKMVRSKKLLDSNGQDVYMPNFNKLNMPITFIHGEKNEVFVPESTLITFNKLVALYGPDKYNRIVINNYGHNDCMYGKNALTDVYPFILNHLEQFYKN